MHPPPFDFEAGEILLIDKPQGWTSFDIVNKIRYAVKAKTGHAGTLDPLATGLLILCTGKMTRSIEKFMAQEKEYTGTLKFGASTASYDSETPAVENFDWHSLDEEKIKKAAENFKGIIMQIPPMYSAIKVDGKRMYDLARAGKTIEIKPREVEVSAFELYNFNLPEVDFRIVCSKGTYIRSIVHDLGKALYNGAYLTALRRVRIGEYKVEDAMDVLEFVNMVRSMEVL
jgi:tRNA pseudouridine55 synthase